MSSKDVRQRMSAAAKRQPAQPATERPQAEPPRTDPYKGTFEMAQPEARQLRMLALEHGVSITRLLEAAALLVLEDEDLRERVVQRAAELKKRRKA